MEQNTITVSFTDKQLDETSTLIDLALKAGGIQIIDASYSLLKRLRQAKQGSVQPPAIIES